MKILFHSTAPWSPSSYSVTTSRIVPDLVRAGHKVTLSTWYGLQGSPLPWQITAEDDPSKIAGVVQVLPHIHAGEYGEQTIDEVYRYFGADILITNSDVFVFPPQKTSQCNYCPYFPTDHSPPAQVVLDALQGAMYPMTYTKWGVRVLEEAGIKAALVPNAAPAKMFTPGPKDKARNALHIPEWADFVVTMVAANKDPLDRKGFNEALLAFAQFHASHPSAVLIVHTYWGGPVKIGDMVEHLNIKEHVFSPDQMKFIFGMLSEQYMVNLYRASDVILNPAKSEGFGLPIVEGQMCGRPVIATDYSSTEELLHAGWKVPAIPDWTVGADSYRARPLVGGIVNALEEAYKERDNEALQVQAREGSIYWDTKNIFEKHWKPALADIERILSERPKFFDIKQLDGQGPKIMNGKDDVRQPEKVGAR